MKALTQKIVLMAAVVIGSLTVTTVAFAAGNVNEPSEPRIGAGLASNEACMRPESSIVVSYPSPFYDETAHQYVVDGLNLANIDSACESLSISITIRDASDAVVAEVSGTITGSTYSARFEPVSAEAVNDAAIVIYRAD